MIRLLCVLTCAVSGSENFLTRPEKIREPRSSVRFLVPQTWTIAAEEILRGTEAIERKPGVFMINCVALMACSGGNRHPSCAMSDNIISAVLIFIARGIFLKLHTRINAYAS